MGAGPHREQGARAGGTGVHAGSAVLTEQDDDADQDGHDGAGAQTGRGHRTNGGAVPVLVARAHLDLDDGRVGQRGVPGVGDDNGDVVHASLEVQDAQAQLGVVTWQSDRAGSAQSTAGTPLQ